MAAADRGGVAQVPFGRNQDAALALDGLEKERAGVRRDRVLERLGVAERDGHEAGSEGTETVTVERLGGEAADGRGAAVEIIFADDDLSAVLRDTLARV